MSNARGRIRLISTDGTTRSVKVLDAAGDEIKWGETGLLGVEVEPLEPNGFVNIRLELSRVDLDLEGTVYVAGNDLTREALRVTDGEEGLQPLLRYMNSIPEMMPWDDVPEECRIVFWGRWRLSTGDKTPFDEWDAAKGVQDKAKYGQMRAQAAKPDI
jgi:hypothetical protein